MDFDLHPIPFLPWPYNKGAEKKRPLFCDRRSKSADRRRRKAGSGADAKAVRARFSPLARELNVNIVAGSVSNLRDGKIFNTACIFDRAGACLAEYDKTHPFTPMGEHEVYTP
ncbi:MAG: hypothetical protein EGQ67_03340, partial [Clostridiales bacterium]|nr:hypothetical protein [Clostridiales bacterium]